MTLFKKEYNKTEKPKTERISLPGHIKVLGPKHNVDFYAHEILEMMASYNEIILKFVRKYEPMADHLVKIFAFAGLNKEDETSYISEPAFSNGELQDYEIESKTITLRKISALEV